MVRTSAIVGVVLLFWSAFSVVRAAPAWAASVVLSPSVSEPGGTVTVSGDGFVADLSVTICWGAPSAGCSSLGSGSASGDGSFSLTVTVPSDAGAGDWTVSACQTDPETPGSCAVSASTILSIPAPPPPTTTTTTSTTTTTVALSTTTTTQPPPTTTTTSTTVTQPVPTTSTTTPAPTTTSTTVRPPTPSKGSGAPPVTEAPVAVLSEVIEALATTTTTPEADEETDAGISPTSTTQPEFALPPVIGTSANGALAGDSGGFSLTDPVGFWSLWLAALVAASGLGFLGVKGIAIVRHRADDGTT